MLKICTHNWKLFVEYRIEIEFTITFAFYIHSEFILDLSNLKMGCT
jgi:hypothetical protein